MKRKTICKTINSIFDRFLQTITDKSVAALVEKNTIVTGGCIASMLLREDINDFDLYFRDKETAIAIARFYAGQVKGVEGVSYDEEGNRIEIDFASGKIGFLFTDKKDQVDEKTKKKKKFTPILFTQNAITLSSSMQLVLRFFGEPEEIHLNYDFIHCTNYWDSATRKVTLKAEALESLITKELRYQGSRYPLASLIRIRKFTKRGWSCNAGQFLKMAMQLNDLDLRKIDVLQDQLMGVDAMYFAQLINSIPEDKIIDGQIDTTKIMEMIDDCFDNFEGFQVDHEEES